MNNNVNFKNILTDFVDNKISAIINSYDASANIEHNGTKGDYREDEIRNFISEILPNNLGVSSGIVVDVNGQQSHQLDIVIYDKNILPTFLKNQNLAFFPLDSVKYAIEVKSLINKDEMENDVVKKFLDFNSLKSIRGRTYITALMAFNTDLKEKEEIERYYEINSNMIIDPEVQIIVAMNQGYYFWDIEVKKINDKIFKIISWYGYKAQNNKELLKLFFVGLMNTLFSEKIGYYILNKPEKFMRYSLCILTGDNEILYKSTYFDNPQSGSVNFSYKIDENGKISINL